MPSRVVLLIVSGFATRAQLTCKRSAVMVGIHYVPWNELIALEKARTGQVINFKARLVGSDGLGLSSNGMDIQRGVKTHARVSSDAGLRCNNCPSRGCAACPMCVTAFLSCHFWSGKLVQYLRDDTAASSGLELVEILNT